MGTITKTPITPITLGDSVDPTVANTPHDNLETNIDNIIAYIKSSTAGAFEYNTVTSTGLIFEYDGGIYNNQNVSTVIAAGNRSLNASVTSYIEINTSTGAITHNTTVFTAANIPLWEVVTGVSTISSVIDRRSSFFLRNTLGITDTSTSSQLTLSDAAAAFIVPITVSGVTVALLASPAFTGTPTAPTPTAGDNSTKIATTAYSDAVTGLKISKTSDTGSGVMPVGTTAQRDGTPLTGYLRHNTSYGRAEEYDGANWKGLGGATGAGGDDVFYENGQTVTTSYTLTANKNAMSAGDITIDTGVTVTIPTGAIWSIV